MLVTVFEENVNSRQNPFGEVMIPFPSYLLRTLTIRTDVANDGSGTPSGPSGMPKVKCVPACGKTCAGTVVVTSSKLR